MIKCSKLFVLFSFLLCACAIAITPASSGKFYYGNVQNVNLVQILPPPPAPTSIAEQVDRNAVWQAQQRRTMPQIQEAQLDVALSIFRFQPVLRNTFSPENLPVTTAFFDRVKHDEGILVEQAKAFYHRPRPFTVDARIKPVVAQPANAAYPSGHTVFAYVTATLLVQMLPERKQEIFDRAWHFADNRIIAGVHYPTDIEAGKIAAALIVQNLLQNAQFQQDFQQAKRELRANFSL